MRAVPPAAVCMLPAISRVVAPCSSTAAAIVLATAVSSSMARAIEDISSTECLVACWIEATRDLRQAYVAHPELDPAIVGGFV